MSQQDSEQAHAAPDVRVQGPEDWYRDAIIYELHVRAFADSNGDGIGDFTGLAPAPRLPRRPRRHGDLAAAVLPLAAARRRLRHRRLPHRPPRLRRPAVSSGASSPPPTQRNIRVITELVVNHTSDQHPWFQRARRAPAGLARARLLRVERRRPTATPTPASSSQDFETSNWTWDPVAERLLLAPLLLATSRTSTSTTPTSRRPSSTCSTSGSTSASTGCASTPCRTSYEREGTNCENLPETHDVLKRLRKHLDANYPDRMLLAEANQWPEDAAAYFGDGDECHMNFHFPVMPRLFMALRLEHRTPIVDIMEQTPEPPPGGQWATFLRNHDELTLEMVTDEERDLMLRAYATDIEMRINLGIRRRLAPLLGNDRRKIELLNALLFSLPGTPVIYYGDEIGMGDNVYLGDRNGVRTPMQWSADRNAGFSTRQPAPALPAADHRAGLPLRERQRREPGRQPGVAAVVDAPADRAAQAPPRARSRARSSSSSRRTTTCSRSSARQLTYRPSASTRCCASPTCRGWPSRSSSTCATFAGVGAGRGVRAEPLRADRRPAVPADAGAVRLLLVRPRRRARGRRAGR